MTLWRENFGVNIEVSHEAVCTAVHVIQQRVSLLMNILQCWNLKHTEANVSPPAATNKTGPKPQEYYALIRK
jgi:hypothetical protein